MTLIVKQSRFLTLTLGLFLFLSVFVFAPITVNAKSLNDIKKLETFSNEIIKNKIGVEYNVSCRKVTSGIWFLKTTKYEVSSTADLVGGPYGASKSVKPKAKYKTATFSTKSDRDKYLQKITDNFKF